MKLSQKAQDFMQKIIKYYPLQQHTDDTHKNTTKISTQHMHDYRKEREIYQKTTEEKLKNMSFFKEEGNNHFKNNRYTDAAYFYQKAIIYSHYTFPQNEKDQQILDQLLTQISCNLGLCYIKMDDWKKAKTNLVQASKSKLPKTKAKGLYWLTKYYIRQGEMNLASETLSQIKKMGQNYSKEQNQLEEMYRKSQKKYKDQQKKFSESVFSK